MLLEHNIETYNQLCDTMDTYGHAMIIQTTGSGKSYIALEYIEDNQFNTLVVVPTHVIGEQWNNKSELITYVCYDTFVKIKTLTEYDLVIFDEAHHLGASTYEAAFNEFIKLNIPYIGLTADSVRWTDSARDISSDYFVDSTICGLTLEDGIKQGILPSIEYTVAIYSPSEFASSYLKGKKISESLVARLNYTIDNTKAITDIIKDKLDTQSIKGVLFVESINRVAKAYNLLTEVFGNNIDIFDIHSRHTSEYNLKQIELFKNSDKAFIIAVNMLNEGLHVDDVNTIIMLRRTTSPNVYFQQIGRGISIGSNRRLQVFDLVGNKNLLRVMSHKDSHRTIIHESIENLESDQFIINDLTTDILDVLTDINDYLLNKWAQWEIDKVRLDYPLKGSNIPELLSNGRSHKAIQATAKRLGLKNRTAEKVQKIWSSSEIEKLKSDYPVKGSNIPELIANGRTQAAIKIKAKTLGITKRKGGEIWSSSEIEKLKSDYPIKGSNIPELLNNGRSREAILSKAKELGIQYGVKFKKWSNQAIEKLKSDYLEKGCNIPELLEMGYSKESIMTKASRLGLIRKRKKL